jgi:uncharacterized protein
MDETFTSFLSPKCEAHEKEDTSCGVYAIQPLMKDELVVVWGGEVMDYQAFMKLPDKLRSLSVQVEESQFLVPHRIGPADCFNHSCDPNVGIVGQIVLVALRNIEIGEELCFDYAMTDGCPYDEFDCYCGSQNCRGRITGDDWKIPELWKRYRGHFAPYLQRRIDALQASLLDRQT